MILFLIFVCVFLLLYRKLSTKEKRFTKGLIITVIVLPILFFILVIVSGTYHLGWI